ncbi:RNA polymerase sigma factor [Fictibacillus terranigra]|uniref:RNA polymerase sigma factor n=1 Tax=Fictibacillus terranigra TaxID=3058424 RepID=A0ABT8E345_9BACL|nr:RNA polymerase sigma factor [Fictibacillus sp. CENA-BCM004]MDN4072329.1 RNA polymerase sigma factor [Fictibacillus sp. CENA-BCM004]
MTNCRTHRTIEGIWTVESARIIAGVARIIQDVSIAEDLAQDTLAIALEKWPESGIPEKPGAWLMTVAKRLAINLLRRNKLRDQKYEEIGRKMEFKGKTDYDSIDEEINDDLLRLIFTTCHPVLSREARVALTLKLLCGLKTDEIAQAFLVSESTIAQRIVRAKRTLSASKVPFEVPCGLELSRRMSSVLDVIYLMFNEGYSATGGENWIRPTLCSEAIRLGRMLAEILPEEPEVHGLIALMEIQASRFKARIGPSGEPILLQDQNRALWDDLLIHRGYSALKRIEQIGGAYGPYSLQACIAACHAKARTASETDWQEISALYDALSQVAPSPIVELNRAVAISMAYGPAAGLEIVDALEDEPSLKKYHLLPAVRGDLLAKLERNEEACAEFKRAASLTQNEQERALLLKRAADYV